MRAFASPAAFAAHLRQVTQAIPAAEHAGLSRAAALVETEAKALIGQEVDVWPALADRTIAEKQRLGFTGRVSATDPLLRTGEMRDSISHEVEGRVAVIGSTDPVAIYQETGTSRIPPRPFLATALYRVGEQAANTVSEAVGRAVAGLRPSEGD